MSTRTELDALALRCEGADGADRELKDQRDAARLEGWRAHESAVRNLMAAYLIGRPPAIDVFDAAIRALMPPATWPATISEAGADLPQSTSACGPERAGVGIGALSICPDGWVLVPREPTEAMVVAGLLEAPTGVFNTEIAPIYRAMIAAPPPPAATEAPSDDR